MSDGNKTIRLGVAFDDVGFRRFKSALREVTAEAAQAFQTLNRSSLAAVVGGGTLPGQWGSGGFAQRSGVSSQVVQATKSNPMTGGMVQGLQQQQNALKIIASGSKDAMKAMVDATKSALGDQKRELDSLSKTIDQLGRRYNDLIKSAEDFRSKGMLDIAGVKQASAQGVMGNLLTNSSTLGMQQKTVENLESTLSTLEKAIAGAGGSGRPPLGGKGGRDDDGQPKRQMSSYELGMTIASALKGIGGGLSGGGSTIQNLKTLEAQNIAGIMSTPHRFLKEWMGGDFRNLMEMRRSGGQILDDYGGLKAPQAVIGGQALSGIGELAGGVAMAVLTRGAGAGAAAGRAGNVVTGTERMNGLSTATGGVMGTVNSIANFISGGPERMEMDTIHAGQMAQRGWNPLEQESLNMLQAMAPARVRAAKALQGRHMQAWGTGAGFGLDFGESVGAAESLANRFGMAMTMGRGGGRRAGGSVAAAAASTPGNAAGAVAKVQGQSLAGMSRADVGSSLMGDLGGNQSAYKPFGFNTLTETTAAEQAALPAARSGGGGGSNGLLRQALQAERMGFGRDAAGQMLGTLAMGQGGNTQAGWKAFEDVLARGFKRGMEDPRTLEPLMQAATAATFGTGGIGNNAGFVMSTLMGAGLSGKSTMHDVEASIKGWEGGSSILQNNPYFNMVQTSAAIQALGSNASGLGVRGLQMSSLTELMGNGSELLTDLGVTKEQRQQTGETTLRNLLGSFAGNESTPELAAALRGGGSLSAALARSGTKGMKQAAASIFESQPEYFGNDYSAAKKFVAQVANLGMDDAGVTMDSKQKAEFQRMLKGNSDGMAETSVAAQQKVLFKLLEEETKYRKDYLAAIRGLDGSLDALKQASQDPGLEAGKTFMVKVISEVNDQQLYKDKIKAGVIRPSGVK